MKIPKIKIFQRQPPPTPRRRLTDRDDTATSPTRGHAERVDQTTFRRNSTITGSRSSAVRSVSELDSQLQSPRARTHHLRRRQRSLSSLFAISMLVIVGLAVLIQQFTAGVTTSIYGQIGAASTTSEQKYSETVQQYLNRRPVERLRSILNSDNLANYLQQAGYSELAGVESVAADGFGATHIKLKVREPVASWTIAGVKRYVDRDGIIFSQNYFQEPAVRIVDRSGVNIDEADGSVTSSRFLAFVGQSVGLLRDDGLDIRQVVIPSTGTRQVEFVLSNKDIIKMTVDRQAGEQAEDASQAWQHLQRQKRSVKYIDVRVSGQAYYK